jgi:hypothetical protein
MLVAIAAGISYGNLSDKGLSYTLMLLVGCLFIGVSEELMFRGIGVTAFRQAGFTEGNVALWTCALFGLAHATNIFSEGVGALPQVLITAVAGYFFYVIRRVSGLLIVSMIMHGLWDFGLFTNTLRDPPGIGVAAFIVADIVLAIVAIVTIRKVFPRTSSVRNRDRQQLRQICPGAAGDHAPVGDGIGPAEVTGDQGQPGLRVGLHHIRRGSPGVGRPGDRLHGAMRRDPNLNGPARVCLGQPAQRGPDRGSGVHRVQLSRPGGRNDRVGHLLPGEDALGHDARS